MTNLIAEQYKIAVVNITVSQLTNQVAILFTTCREIRLTHVYGTGVVIYNSMGVVYIDRCSF